MKLPKKLKVGGHIYKIIFPFKFTERVDLVGQHDSQTLEIRVNDKDSGGRDIADSRIKEVFWHEILHAIDVAYNGDKIEEDTVRRLSEGLYQVLNDNFIVKVKENL